MPWHKNSTWWTTGYHQLFAYLFLVFFVLVGFYKVEATADRVDAEARNRTLAQCETTNDGREAIRNAFRKYNDILIGSAARTERTPQEQAQFDAQVQEFKGNIEQTIIKPLKTVNCKKLLE